MEGLAEKSKDLTADRETFYEGMRRDSARRYQHRQEAATEVLFNILHTYIALESRISYQLQQSDMTLPGFNVLTILRQHKESGCPLNRLSDLLLVSRANITGLVDSLVRKGYVKRCDHKEDRRVCLACITPAGESFLDRYLPNHFKDMGKMFTGLSASEKKTLSQLLAKLRHVILQHSTSKES